MFHLKDHKKKTHVSDNQISEFGKPSDPTINYGELHLVCNIVGFVIYK